jgi:voltage-gated potassium channel
MNSKRFSVRHIPKYSRIFISALTEPLAVYLTVAGNAITLLAAFFFYQSESHINPHVQTYFDAFWWAMTTVTTVGFGDIVPMTFEGRIVAMFLMVTGILCFFAFTAIIVTVITAISAEELEETESTVKTEIQELYSRLDRIESLLKHNKKS